MSKKVKFRSGCEVSIGEWTGWHVYDGQQYNCMFDGTWTHNLCSHLNEGNPDANHVHYKFKQDKSGPHSYVVCSVKVGGMREVNRRELIENINRETGLNIDYR